jgi:hypothetical protein
MSGQKGELSDERREEIRGLFTLGLMAVLITLRVTQTEIIFHFLGQEYIMTEVIDVSLGFWALYALFMIIWLSDDWLPKKVCKIAYELGRLMLVISFTLFYFTLVAIFSFVPMPYHLITYLLLVPLWYLFVRGVIQVAEGLSSMLKVINKFLFKRKPHDTH